MVVFSLGYSHPIEYPLPTGVDVAVDPKQTQLTVTGIDRQKVGQVAAEMRSLRPPDPVQEQGCSLCRRALEEEGWKDRSEISRRSQSRCGSDRMPNNVARPSRPCDALVRRNPGTKDKRTCDEDQERIRPGSGCTTAFAKSCKARRSVRV